MKTLYTAIATSSGDGRNGAIRSSDGALDSEVRMPPELGGAGGATNPEQLFAAGYAACFHSALRLVASQSGADTTGSEVVAQVSLQTSADGVYGLAVQLEVSLPSLDDSVSQALVERAHGVCPYSRAVRGNVDVDLEVRASALGRS